MDDTTIMRIAADHPHYGRDMDDAIRAEGWSPAQFFLRLTHLLRSGEAARIDPTTANRLQRIQEQRRGIDRGV